MLALPRDAGIVSLNLSLSTTTWAANPPFANSRAPKARLAPHTQRRPYRWQQDGLRRDCFKRIYPAATAWVTFFVAFRSAFLSIGVGHNSLQRGGGGSGRAINGPDGGGGCNPGAPNAIGA